MTLRDDITSALSSVPETDFHFVRLHSHQDILDRIAERFLIEGRQDLRYVWLWERFRHELASSHPPDPLADLVRRLRPDERYWFLASDQQGKYWVADATGSGILTTLREMYGFEYYVVNRPMHWLICENHHGILIEASSDPALSATHDQPRANRPVEAPPPRSAPHL